MPNGKINIFFFFNEEKGQIDPDTEVCENQYFIRWSIVPVQCRENQRKVYVCRTNMETVSVTMGKYSE